ncbi:SPOR domain-containing protein [Deinococcus sp. A31D244]|uniref:SPOR domain-containing protein n=1 Tax=Deinococcus sp. A31D244 TaxID=3397675 RepID=UPI0039E15B71
MTRPASGPRRWPDLLIGLLVLLLLGGFGTLLLRGTPQPAATSAAGTDTATDASIPAAPGTDPAAVQAAPTGTLESAPAETAPAGTTDSGAAAPSDTTAQDTAPVIEAAPIGAPLVADPASTEPASPNPADATGSTEASTDTATTPEDQTATDPATTGGPTPRPEGAVRTSESRVPLRSDYRITLGTFNSETAAQNAAAPVQGIGYTVYPIDLGAQVVAQIGPFADEQSARQALADVQRAYPGAVLYPPRNQPAADSTTPASPAPTADTPAATSPTTSAPGTIPAPSGPTYLQVGAFDRVESAQNLVQQLRDLGYAPTVNAPEGKKVTVLVGPYANPDALTRTETRLATNGLDSFRVR